MIAVKLEGRLGNQLFQYAFIYASAKKLGTKFYIDKRIEPFLLPQYFNLPKDHFHLIDNYLFGIEGYKHIFSHHLKLRFYQTIQWMLNLDDLHLKMDVPPEIEMGSLSDNKLYHGFFQSEIYFKELSSAIKRLFVVQDKYRTEFLKIAEHIIKEQQLVTVHVRRGDYTRLGMQLDFDYYHKAIKSIHSEQNYYVFVCDEPAAIRSEFGYLTKAYISENKDIVDFQFITHADICILSNSSFSWWGAYLNKKNAKVIAPRHWLGKNDVEFPHSVIANNWERL